MIRRIPLSIRLVAAFMVMAGMVGLTSFVGYRAVSGVHTQYDIIVDTHVPGIEAISNMHALALRIGSQTADYVSVIERNGSDAEAKKNDLLASLDQLADQEKEYLEAEEREVEESDEVDQEVEDLKAVRQEVAEDVQSLISAGISSPEGSSELQKEVVRSQTELSSLLGSIVAEEFEHIEELDTQADEQARSSISGLVLIAAVSVFFALALGLLIATRISRRIRKLRDGVFRLSSGDFGHKVTIKSRDELGELAKSFNGMSERLQSSYRRLALESERDIALIEAMREGLIAVDEKGKVVLLNKVGISMLNIANPLTAVGRSIFDLAELRSSNDKPLPPDKHPVAVTLSGGQAVSEVLGFVRQDKKVLLNVSSSPVLLEGKVAGAVVVVRDVTKEKEIDRMKTEFISLASHQLRTPLSAIKWFSEMLLNGDAGKLTDEQTDFAQNIADSTERMIELVNSLLNISRIESGRIIIDPKPTDLSELVGGIVNDLKAKTEQKQQTLIVSVHKELGKINVDPRLIGQVYLNFLTNAIKYTAKAGEISVFISRRGEEVVSQISDNGYGIPKDEQEKVFKKFFRGENVAKFETDGTGLGLYLVKAIIESSGGRIWFESEEGKGTTFWFSLPLGGMKAREGEVTLDI